MFTKCQLIHLDNLKPKNVEEMDILLASLEVSVVFFVLKSITNNAYDIGNIYCNRKLIGEQRDVLLNNSRFTNDPEMFDVNKTLMQFINELIDTYYILKKTNQTQQVNIEISLLTRHNISIACDLF